MLAHDNLTNSKTSPFRIENEQIITKFNLAEHILRITIWGYH